ncbi:LuxR C-terminal-related transcriptional regulator [Halalkalibaculum sp. DA3122]
MDKSNILVVNFHKLVRDGIISMLEATNTFNVFEAQRKSSIHQVCQEQKIDIVIYDVQISNIDSLYLTRELKGNYPDIEILTLFTTVDKETIKKLHSEGVSGYLLKDSGRDELLEAIDTLLEGSMYFSDKITLTAIQILDGNSQADGSSSNSHPLTDRELQVLDLIVNEFTNPEIAEKLSISVRTVDAHRRNLLQKTGVRNTAGLVRYALKNKLV